MSERLWSTPLPGLLLTLAAYELARAVQRRGGEHPLLNPVALSAALVIAVLQLLDVSYARYADSARLLLWLLGPATVALAVPLARELPRLSRLAWPVLVAVTAGAFTSIISAVLLARWTGASELLVRSLAPKSATTPIAIGIAEKVGAAPELTAALVVASGIVGATFGPLLLDLLGTRDPRVRGIATGTAAHGIGTASLYRTSPEASAYSGLAMGLSGLITALLVPWLLQLLGAGS
ncbi:MAG TPA: LrgB family protein [Polyangiaceae bacterium]